MEVSKALLLIPDLRNPEFHGGIQVFNNFLVQALHDLGIETTVIGLNDRPEDRIPGLIPCNTGARRARFKMVSHAMWQSMRQRPDLLICGHRNFAPVASWIARLTRVPMLTITHGFELWDASPAQLKAFRRSRGILAVSRYTRGLNLDKLPGYPPEKVMVFHNTFNENRFVPGKPSTEFLQSMGLSPSDWIVLTVGRLASVEPLKGYDQGVRAMAEVAKLHPNVRYVLAGRGDDMDRLRSIADETGLGDRLIMPGFVNDEDLQSLFNACNLFMLPSRQEGFGIVFLEAMGCGKPVIGGNQDGSMDPLCDGELGTAVDPRNVDEIVSAVLEHVEGRAPKTRTDPDHLRREVIERFGYDRYRSRLQEVLKSL